MSMDAGFQAIYDWDFFAITMLALVCAGALTSSLVRPISRSFVPFSEPEYRAVCPLCRRFRPLIGVLYGFRQAEFLVTGRSFAERSPFAPLAPFTI